MSSLKNSLWKWPKALGRIFLVAFSAVVLVVALNFPYHSDAPPTAREIEAAQKYYADAYRKPSEPPEVQSEYDTKYLRFAQEAVKTFRIKEQVQAFVDQFGLHDKKVLEIGSGRGYLQDLVEDYTGLDISATVARFYHKTFVLGSATALPFRDNSFDAIWSIWVFEHVLNPEQALAEARRVTKSDGLLFLLPGWNSASWYADGYEVRPYSDFGLLGKLIKASVPLRRTMGFKAATALPVRAVRAIFSGEGPTKLRYRRLIPNYEIYWTWDSDAVNSLDSYEALLWFTSRGDECLNCGSDAIFFPFDHTPLVIRVRK